MPILFTSTSHIAAIDTLEAAFKAFGSQGLSPIDRSLITEHFAYWRKLGSMDGQVELRTNPDTKVTQVTFRMSPRAFGQRRNG